MKRAPRGLACRAEQYALLLRVGDHTRHKIVELLRWQARGGVLFDPCGSGRRSCSLLEGCNFCVRNRATLYATFIKSRPPGIHGIAVAVGDKVNLEIDTLARYVARLAEAG